MDCEQAFDRMYRYLDGEVTIYRRWKITRHLNRCPPCAHGFDFEMEVRQVVSSRCRDQMPPELKRRIADCLASERVERGPDERRQAERGQ